MSSNRTTTNALPAPSLKLDTLADHALHGAAKFWFIVAVIGQWIFAFYVATFYGGSAIQGDFEHWNTVLPKGYVAGETMGNLAVAMHVFLAVIIIVGGPLQIIPQVRTYARTFHQWNGRLYILTAFLISMAGIYMVLTRGTVGGFIGQVSITINGILIMICAAMALRYALIRKFDIHRRWTLRLFLVVSGVWFFRVGLMFWLLVNGGPVGFDPETFQGPFLTFLGFGQYILPLAILELYFYMQKRGSIAGRFTMAAGLLVLALVIGTGIFAATMGMWLPRI